MPEQTTRLAEIQAREAAATGGTWGTHYDGTVYYLASDIRLTSSGATCSRQIAELHDDPDDKTQTYRDASFIARARDDVRFLLAEVARLTAEKAELDKVCDEVMRERDGLHDALDKFAQTVAPEDVIGEHSSGNNPWANALDLVTPMAEVDKLRAENAELEKALGLNETAAA
ncbi:hypothetical protein OG369_10060 [Streptomyces sp. NBC_01221]|uniref:hypothetical protein n=1 Tax=Streptomyces sp. NBC_01221 TaxID=2903782 RepID=UPI00224F96AD|nr:hypothetical protein [Streptomyces sp. NBC_01221]MCX4786516.1 hypothetical protein [Streptomyces sp. NBC_01221]